MPSAERRAPPLQCLTEQRLSLTELALGLQLRSKRLHGEGCAHSEALGSAHRGTRPCTGRIGRPRPRLGSCAAIARHSACAPTWLSRGRRTAARADRRPHPLSTAGTSSPQLPSRNADVLHWIHFNR
eukprot:scaffold61427_cov70-Phaeocystis_antarctica.AAC.3